MCCVFSWLEANDGTLYWLEDDIIEAKGWNFLDSIGHSAIEKYYGIKGENYESMTNIPPVMAERVDNGYMNKMMKACGISCRYNKNGELNGEFIRYYDNGIDIEKKYNLVNGIIHGEYISYHKNGNICEKCNYVNGLMHGEYINYLMNGNKYEKYNYVNGIKHGEYISYYKDGTIQSKCNYINGQIKI